MQRGNGTYTRTVTVNSDAEYVSLERDEPTLVRAAAELRGSSLRGSGLGRAKRGRNCGTPQRKKHPRSRASHQTFSVAQNPAWHMTDGRAECNIREDSTGQCVECVEMAIADMGVSAPARRSPPPRRFGSSAPPHRSAPATSSRGPSRPRSSHDSSAEPEARPHRQCPAPIPIRLPKQATARPALIPHDAPGTSRRYPPIPRKATDRNPCYGGNPRLSPLRPEVP
jgi:hypothetical protein